MLGHRLQRWPNIKSASGRHIVSIGDDGKQPVSRCGDHISTAQSQNTITAHFSSKKLLDFGFERQIWIRHTWMTDNKFHEGPGGWGDLKTWDM